MFEHFHPDDLPLLSKGQRHSSRPRPGNSGTHHPTLHLVPAAAAEKLLHASPAPPAQDPPEPAERSG